MKEIKIVTDNGKIVMSFYIDEKFIRSEKYSNFGNKGKLAIKEFLK